jgi:hypothetical protein
LPKPILPDVSPMLGWVLKVRLAPEIRTTMRGGLGDGCRSHRLSIVGGAAENLNLMQEQQLALSLLCPCPNRGLRPA